MPSLKDLEAKYGLPPLTQVTSLITSPTMKRLDVLLAKLERLSQDKQALAQAIQLLELVERLDRSGGLRTLDDALNKLPKGTSGKALIAELQRVLNEFAPRLDKLISMLDTLLKEEKEV